MGNACSGPVPSKTASTLVISLREINFEQCGFFNRLAYRMRTFLAVVLHLACVWAQTSMEVDSDPSQQSGLSNVTSTPTPNVSPSGKLLPTFSFLSFGAGMLIMIVSVLSPVALMGYRNRNSILEFIKNR
jgi:hypothetical protein